LPLGNDMACCNEKPHKQQNYEVSHSSSPSLDPKAAGVESVARCRQTYARRYADGILRRLHTAGLRPSWVAPHL